VGYRKDQNNPFVILQILKPAEILAAPTNGEDSFPATSLVSV
jgi:hypothetical protein